MREPVSFAPSETDEAPRLNRRQAAKVRTRQKVLDSARALFAERGYDPATIRDIAREAGMSTGAVFANFQDKAELFEAVLAEDMAAMGEVLAQGAGSEGGVRARILGALNAGYSHSIDHLPLVQAVVSRSWFQPRDAEERTRKAIRPLLDVLTGALKAGLETGEVRKDADVNLLGEMIYSAYLANYRRAAYDGWTAAQLGERMAKQVDVILAGALARQ